MNLAAKVSLINCGKGLKGRHITVLSHFHSCLSVSALLCLLKHADILLMLRKDLLVLGE